MTKARSTKVIPWKPRNQNQITQADLEMFILLQRELREAKERLISHGEYLRERLTAEAEIQDGVHVALLRPNPRARRPRLIVR